MKIRITNIQNTTNNLRLVAFSSPVGNGQGSWYSSWRPEREHEYSVEFDVDEKDIKIISSECQTYTIQEKNGNLRLIGTVDGIDDDGLFYFRLGISCLIMIDPTEDLTLTKGQWLELSMKPNTLKIKPFGY